MPHATPGITDDAVILEILDLWVRGTMASGVEPKRHLLAPQGPWSSQTPPVLQVLPLSGPVGNSAGQEAHNR